MSRKPITAKPVAVPAVETLATEVPVAPPPGPRRYLTRDDILASDDLKREDVWCPNWGGWVTIRAMTGKERALWDDMLIANPDEVAAGADPKADMQDYQGRLVSLTAVDQDGNRIFMPDDKMFLGEKNAVDLYRCYTVAARLSGLTRAAMDAMTQTLGKGPSDSSGSA